MSKEFLNFAEISKSIPFSDVLDWLNIGYTERNGELRGDGFIINIEKNLFFAPDNDDLKGSVINFVAHYKKVELREAASLLKIQFLSKKQESKPKREMPNLSLEWNPYIQERGINLEIATEYEIGYVKQRSIVAGRIAFKMLDHLGKHIGYIGYKPEDASWYFPKGFKRPLYNAHKLKDTKSVIVTVDPFDALKLVTLGFRQVASLLANSMTAEQEEILNKFQYILLLHKDPQNIINRLYSNSFIKAPVLFKPLMDLADHEIHNLISPGKNHK